METFNDSTQRTISLRPYQQEALAAIADAESRGIRRQLVSLPTGTGKTVIFAHLLQQRSERALVLAHRDELIEQAQPRRSSRSTPLLALESARPNATNCIVRSS